MPQKLTQMPSLVESPFIIVKIGNYEFGSYQRNKNAYSGFGAYSSVYPNFMESIEINKINGEVNRYTINMKYQITRGDDPNFLEKVFSTISKDRKITISYGDWASPTYIYKEEHAIVTNISSRANIRSSSITYSLSCILDSLSILSTRFNFPATKSKGSTVIINMLKDPRYGFLDVFKGMQSSVNTPYSDNSFIDTDDAIITLEAKTNCTPLEYLQYVVGSMQTNDTSVKGHGAGHSFDKTTDKLDPFAFDLGINPLNRNNETKSYLDSDRNSSAYFLSINGDSRSEKGGAYFEVKKVSNSTKAITTVDSFEVDVNYPGDNFVTDFSVNNDKSWSLLYDYTEEDATQPNYTYRIDNEGQTITENSPNLTVSNKYMKSTDFNKAWWEKMTGFPITATLTIKGITRPAILMSYVKINVYFYGEKSIYSGWYIITAQNDRIDSNGYRTTLNLTRIGSDIQSSSPNNMNKIVADTSSRTTGSLGRYTK